MNHLRIIALCLGLCAIVLGACSPAATPAVPTAQPAAPTAGIANPASTYCIDHGGKLQIITAADGSQSGQCTLPDGTQCDEWAYYRGECGPAAPTTQAPPQGVPPAPGRSDPAAADYAAKQAAEKLAADLKVDTSSVTVVSSEMVTWSDSCLGLGGPAESCLQVETPGFRVVLSVDGKTYIYRTDFSGSNVRLDTTASGG